MRNFLLVALAGFLVTGCGYVDRKLAGYTGKASETCYQGVL